MSDIFFIHSSVEKHLGYFHVLDIVNRATMNFRLHVSFQHHFFILLLLLVCHSEAASCFRTLVGLALFSVTPFPLSLYSWLALRWCSFPSSNFTCSSWEKILAAPCAILIGLSTLGSCCAGYSSFSMYRFSRMSRGCSNRCSSCRRELPWFHAHSLIEPWVPGKYSSAFPVGGAALTPAGLPPRSEGSTFWCLSAKTHQTWKALLFSYLLFHWYMVPFPWSALFPLLFSKSSSFPSTGMNISLKKLLLIFLYCTEFLELPLHFSGHVWSYLKYVALYVFVCMFFPSYLKVSSISVVWTISIP